MRLCSVLQDFSDCCLKFCRVNVWQWADELSLCRDTSHKPLKMILKSPDFTVVNTPGIGNQNISIVQGDNRLKAVRCPLKHLQQRTHESSAILSKRALAFRCFSCSSAAGSESTTTAPPAPIVSWS